ncbi:MAG: alanine racemase [Longispora sp.]|nr:alanine racemase [Longispora sp. (in: high G+C Gram-positive bacteria)]
MMGELVRPVCAYWYDPQMFTERVRALRATLPDGARLLYAVKANSHRVFVEAAAAYTDGCEVASGGEFVKAVAAGARTIIASGPGKTDAYLRAAVTASVPVIINVESVWELQRLIAVADGPVDVCVRVNRSTVNVTGSHRMTGVPTPFGVDEKSLRAVMDLAADSRQVTVRGLHLHAVSNNFDAAAHVAFIREAVAFTDAHLPDATVINVGGGLGVDYLGERDFDLAVFARGLPRDPRLVFEVGRYLVADAGHYAAEVIDLKRNHGKWFAVLRGGTHHFRLPAAWGYDHPFRVHPVEDWPYALTRPEVTDVAVTVVGELCTPRDVLCRDQHVPRLRVGDVLVFDRAGAYGYEVSHHDFLSHDPPQFFIGVLFAGSQAVAG